MEFTYGGRAAIGYSQGYHRSRTKNKDAEEKLILLPKMKQLFLFAQLTSDHMFDYFSLGTICFSNVLFSNSFL